MIEVKGLSAGYGAQPVLQDISFQLPAGQNLSVLGANGSGKSTLLKALAGILPHTGEVLLDGVALDGLPRKKLATQVALMGQTMAPGFGFTVYDTVLQGRYAHQTGFLGGASTQDREIAEASMRATGVADLRKRPITALSGGQLQRVFLARTLAQQPRVILLDEPTNHLDLKYQAELVEYLRDWSRGDGRAVVSVFHDISQALSLSGHALVLHKGRQAAFGPMGQAVTPALLQEVYGMDVVRYMKQNLKRWEAL